MPLSTPSEMFHHRAVLISGDDECRARILIRRTHSIDQRSEEQPLKLTPVLGSPERWRTAAALRAPGLTAGTELKTTVLPFILRGVKRLGMDSVMCPAEMRLEVWRRLATNLRPTHLGRIANLIGVDDLPAAFTALLKGEAQGRYVVRLRG